MRSLLALVALAATSCIPSTDGFYVHSPAYNASFVPGETIPVTVQLANAKGKYDDWQINFLLNARPLPVIEEDSVDLGTQDSDNRTFTPEETGMLSFSLPQLPEGQHQLELQLVEDDWEFENTRGAVIPFTVAVPPPTPVPEDTDSGRVDDTDGGEPEDTDGSEPDDTDPSGGQ